MAMDRCYTLNVKNATGAPVRLRNPIPERPISWNLSNRDEAARRVFGIRFRRARASSFYRPLVVRAMAKKNSNRDDPSSGSGNGDQSIPGGDDTRGNRPSESNKYKDFASQNAKLSDWRGFRANLVAWEREDIANPDAQGGVPYYDSKPLGLKWAHPIPLPETGCVLVATEKLDGINTFERTVVLLLKAGTRHPLEGPVGIVLNRPFHKRVKDMKPTNLHLATIFSDCSLHFGGPLEERMFFLRSGENTQLSGFEEVIPGLCFGERDSLHNGAEMVRNGLCKPQDFRFFVGFSEWQKDQLKEEIESGYWHVASCSSNLIFGGSSDSSSEALWEEILQLMGGQYSELSRKPKQDM